MKTSNKRLATTLAGWLALGAFALSMPLVASAQKSPAPKPTVVLVHGAFAESSSWNGVIGQLHDKGYTVIAAANELRSVKSDAASVTSVVKSIHGPVVLVGHSYGGSVISEAATGQDLSSFASDDTVINLARTIVGRQINDHVSIRDCGTIDNVVGLAAPLKAHAMVEAILLALQVAGPEQTKGLAICRPNDEGPSR